MFIKYLFCLIVCIFDSRKRYIILNPDLSFLFIKSVLILDKKSKSFFTQKIERFGDFITVFEIFYENNYDLKKFKFWSKIAKDQKKNKTPLIIDCGANIGCSALYFHQNYPESYIVAIEPEKKNYVLLKKNLKNIKKKETINTAVSSSVYPFKLNESPDSRGHTVTLTQKKNLRSKTVTINQILKKFSKKKYSFLIIKIDIEGFEEELFKKNIEWMDKFKIIIIELHDWMKPYNKKSYNFQRSMLKSKKFKDIVISGENLILINY